jgi:hypothetical protein
MSGAARFSPTISDIAPTSLVRVRRWLRISNRASAPPARHSAISVVAMTITISLRRMENPALTVEPPGGWG